MSDEDDPDEAPWIPLVRGECPKCDEMRRLTDLKKTSCPAHDYRCKSCECIAQVFEDELTELAEHGAVRLHFDATTPREERKGMYREFTRLVWGRLGYRCRKDPPQCVKNLIRDMVPNRDPNQVWVGYHSAPEDEE